MSDAIAATAAPPRPTLLQASVVWLRIGLLGFGGPAGQIALMHRELVEKRRWVDEPRFLFALSYCTLLPGPEAQQLATYIGWLLHRTAGGLVAGTLFVLPGALLVLLLSALYVQFGQTALVAGLFFGLKPAVLALVLEALLRVGRRALVGRAARFIAAAAFVAIFVLGVPFPLVVLAAGLLGALSAGQPGAGAAPGTAAGPGGGATPSPAPSLLDALAAQGLLAHTAPSVARSVRSAALWLLIWWFPMLALGLALHRGHILFREGLFFSQAAVVTFGGAYAVLAWVAQQAVENFGWLRPGQMVDGLALAETTPGPLILVLEFVGFLAAARQPGAWHPLLAGTLGAAVALWATFAPCFLWIFAGAPWVESLRGNRRLSSALRGITAAVVGVIANLSVWFGIHVIFREVADAHWGWLSLPLPRVSSLAPGAAMLALAAAVATLRFHLGLGWTLGGCALLGVALHAAGG